MEENPPRVSRKNGTREKKKSRRYSEDDAGDKIECSGQSCRSCTAAMIADCVALCCCPCAVVNFLALAFVKVPWTVGRKCLGLGKKKEKKLESKRKCRKSEAQNDRQNGVVERDSVNPRKERVEEGVLSEISWLEFGDRVEEEEEEERECVSARFEAERVWLELYQVGHLGFGRVSFTGIPPQGKGN
ncbi:hypothetical protein UlMin_043189 [Ulmus minor]